MDATALTSQLGRQANDPEVIRCFTAAEMWARSTLGLAAATVLELRADQEAAILGYAGDLLKLPKSTFGYFDADGDGLPAQVGQIGRRWAPQLLYGTAVLGGLS
jgi:hypothetical protein